MTEVQAKVQLRRLLRSFTTGSLLHLLSDLSTENAKSARREREAATAARYQEVAAALFVLGLGIDAVVTR